MNTDLTNKTAMDTIDLTNDSDDEEIEIVQVRSPEDGMFIHACAEFWKGACDLYKLMEDGSFKKGMKSYFNGGKEEERQRDNIYVGYYARCIDRILKSINIDFNDSRVRDNLQVSTELKLKVALARLHLHELVERIQYETEARFTENGFQLAMEKVDRCMEKYREAFLQWAPFCDLTDPNDSMFAYAPPDELIDFDETMTDRKRKFVDTNRNSRYYN